MPELKVTLFGKFSIQQGDRKLSGMGARKVQELLSYLLLFRNHTQPRESLCEILWGEQSSTQARKSLRQTLWRAQSALKETGKSAQLTLEIDSNWIQINIPAAFRLDISEFENVFHMVKGKRAQELSPRHLKLLEYATSLYKGDLLEGWYQDWCIFERERFQAMHLMLLDKIVQFCELNEKHELGLTYGLEILRHDHAYERTHRQLMRLYAMAGNRTQALQQYRRCVAALRDELGVEPSEKTKQLYEQIRWDRFIPRLFIKEKKGPKTKVRATSAWSDMLQHLEEVSKALSKLEHKIQNEMIALEDTVSRQS